MLEFAYERLALLKPWFPSGDLAERAQRTPQRAGWAIEEREVQASSRFRCRKAEPMIGCHERSKTLVSLVVSTGKLREDAITLGAATDELLAPACRGKPASMQAASPAERWLQNSADFNVISSGTK